jgi:ATP-dependent Clp protease ATP-binding subunit ClpB
MIDPKKMTEKTQEALIAAQQAAQEAGRSQLDVEDLAAALLAQQGGIVPSVIEALGGSSSRANRRCRATCSCPRRRGSAGCCSRPRRKRTPSATSMSRRSTSSSR